TARSAAMVISHALLAWAEAAQSAERPLLLRLSPLARLHALILLVVILLLGLFLYVFIRSLARWIRLSTADDRRRPTLPLEDDWVRPPRRNLQVDESPQDESP